MRRIWNVIGNLVGLAALVVLAVVLSLTFGGLRGEQPTPQESAFQSPLGPTPPPPSLPTATVVGTLTATATRTPGPTPLTTDTPTPPIPTSALPPLPMKPGGFRAEELEIVEEIRLPGDETSSLGPWSPDGSKITLLKKTDHFARTPTGRRRIFELWMMDVLNLSQIRIADNGSWPVWSFDGKRIAYVSVLDDNRSELWVVDTDGVKRTKLADGDTVRIGWLTESEIGFAKDGHLVIIADDGRLEAQHPEIDLSDQFIKTEAAFSPDGRRLAYRKEKHLWIVDLVSMKWFELSSECYPSFATMAWSPDGQRFAYMVGEDTGRPRLWAINSDGTRAIQLAVGEGETFGWPTWSPDSNVIAFDRAPRGAGMASFSKIFVINSDGSSLRYFADGIAPSWSPDGMKMAFGRCEDCRAADAKFQVIIATLGMKKNLDQSLVP